MILDYNNTIISKNFLIIYNSHLTLTITLTLSHPGFFAEREGFEPSIPLHVVYTLSRRAP